MRLVAPLAAAVIAFAVACTSGDGDAPDAEPSPVASPSAAVASAACSPARPAEPGSLAATIAVGGEERAYILHVPDGYDGASAMPLVLVYAGYSLSHEAMARHTSFDALSDAQGFAVAYLAAAGDPPRWNTSEAVDQPDDIAFADRLLDELQSTLCIDESMVFLAGYSSGGGMVQRLACRLGDRLAAIATVAAAYNECQAGLPWIAFHGIVDPLAPFEGGAVPPERGGGMFLNARRTLSEWARDMGCDGLAHISRPSPEVELSTYVACPNGDGEVLLYALIGGGHTWPGAPDLPVDAVGVTSKQIDATATIWEFFAAHRRVN